MSGIISVLSKINNLGYELKILLPNLIFKEIINEADFNQLYKSEIIIADFDLINPHVNSLQETKWIQGTWAGVDKLIPHLDTKESYPFLITRFSGTHFGRLMSEYVVANIVNHERNMFQIYENQKEKKWSQDGKIHAHRCISDLTIGVLGTGTIGKHIGKILHTFGATVWGFGRKTILLNTNEYKYFHKYCNTISKLPQLLSECDYVINVLPNTSDTRGLLNGNMLQNCSGKPTVFMNIGRGTIISENYLTEALEKKWISAAILDVFESEPLPKYSKLWDFEQVFITPHNSGVSRAKHIAEQFASNFELFQTGQQIPTLFCPGNNY